MISPAKHAVALIGVLLALVVVDTRAAEGGYSNYIPGTYGDFGMALAPTETWTLRNDVYSYGADMDESVRSGTLEVGADLDFLVNFTTLLYKPELELFGGQYAAGVLVPLMDAEIEATLDLGSIHRKAKDSASGLGDIALIPVVLYWSEGKYHWSFAHFVVTPTGSYDVDDGINTSLNYWSFDTNFALTYLNEDTGRDLSFNLGYIYNTENDETDYQTGQEIHVDLALNQFLSGSFAIRHWPAGFLSELRVGLVEEPCGLTTYSAYSLIFARHAKLLFEISGIQYWSAGLISRCHRNPYAIGCLETRKPNQERHPINRKRSTT